MSAAPLSANEIEAANRAEATALLIRAGYRVYRPEADVHGEDMVIRTPTGALRSVQIKSRATVEWRRYGGLGLWMLFPDPKGATPGRPWWLIEHDRLFDWAKERHSAAPKWQEGWSYPTIGADLLTFLAPWRLGAVPVQNMGITPPAGSLSTSGEAPAVESVLARRPS